MTKDDKCLCGITIRKQETKSKVTLPDVMAYHIKLPMQSDK